MAASPRIAARPGITVSRTASVAVAVAGVMMLSLRFIHPLPELLVVTFAPALVALALSGGVRAYFRQNARVAALVSGLAGGTWLIVSAGRDENVPAILIGAMVSFLLMIGLALLGTMAVDRVTSRRAAWRG